MELDINNHPVSLLGYPLILVVKHYKYVIDDVMSVYAKTALERISESHHIILDERNRDKEYFHIMLKAQPKTGLTEFSNA